MNVARRMRTTAGLKTWPERCREEPHKGRAHRSPAPEAEPMGTSQPEPEPEMSQPNISYEEAWTKWVQDEKRFNALVARATGQFGKAEATRAGICLARLKRPRMPWVGHYSPRLKARCPYGCNEEVYADKAGRPPALASGGGTFSLESKEGWWTTCWGCEQTTRWARERCPTMARWEENPQGWWQCPSCGTRNDFQGADSVSSLQADRLP